jgi:hypothetical protein
VSFPAGTSLQQSFEGVDPGKLLGDRQYLVQAVATNASGTATSQQLTWTAPDGSAPPDCKNSGIQGSDRNCGLLTLAIPTVTATTAQLTWQFACTGGRPCQTDPQRQFAATLDFGLTNSYGQTASAPTISATSSNTTAVTFSLKNLAPGTLYHVRLNASNTDGLGGGADIVFVTSTLAQPPSAGSLNLSTGTGTVDLPCQSTTGCQGSVTLYSGQPPAGLRKMLARVSRARSLKLGTAKFTIPAHHRTPVHIRLNPTGKRLARGHKSLVVTEVITTISHGHVATITHRLTLRIRH